MPCTDVHLLFVASVLWQPELDPLHRARNNRNPLLSFAFAQQPPFGPVSQTAQVPAVHQADHPVGVRGVVLERPSMVL